MTSSETQSSSLYAAREPIFPRKVKGRFRTLKWWLMGVMLGIYYVTPWLRWDRGENLPDQAVLLDLAHRRFFFFTIEIWPHEFYFVAGLLIMAGLGLFLFTSAAGRVWCGYACPQTVWTDLFMLVERWIEGDRNAQLRLHRQKWDREKLGKRLVKWSAWLLIALLTGGAWVFYFADAPTLLGNLLSGEAPPVAYLTLLFLTLTTFAFGGFAREQMCVFACPWPRIQAAMMDEDTITIGYRFWRGEPRGKLRKKDTADSAARKGDCIDCMACANVCPMGIDIRDGQQLACITCGLCIDACNDMMDKIGKPRGLIGYLALTDEAAEQAGQPVKSIRRHIFRPRTILYTTLWSGVGVGLVILLLMRSSFDVNVTPVRNPLYVTLKDGSIRNTYDLRLRNKDGDDREFTISITGPEGLSLSLEGAEAQQVLVPANETKTQRIYIVAQPKSAVGDGNRSDLTLWVEGGSRQERSGYRTVFNGKGE